MFLQVNTGTWNPTAQTYNTQWEHCDVTPAAPISGATNKTYQVQPTDVGHTLCVVVSGWNSAGNSQPTTTAPSGVVTSGPPFEASSNGSPKVSGSAVVGQKLTASTGNWRGSAPISYTYQWKRCAANGSLCGQSITGAPSSSPTYVLQSADLGHTVRAYVIATNSVGSTTGGSAQTAVVKATGAGTGPGSGPATGGSKNIRGPLLKALVAQGSGAKIRTLLKHGGYSLSFAAPSAGRLTIAWYGQLKGKRILVGTAAAKVHKAGNAKLKILLTAKGRQLLKHARKARLTASGGFTPVGGGTTNASRAITLKA
jgi:hypothetical protein